MRVFLGGAIEGFGRLARAVLVCPVTHAELYISSRLTYVLYTGIHLIPSLLHLHVRCVLCVCANSRTLASVRCVCELVCEHTRACIHCVRARVRRVKATGWHGDESGAQMRMHASACIPRALTCTCCAHAHEMQENAADARRPLALDSTRHSARLIGAQFRIGPIANHCAHTHSQTHTHTHTHTCERKSARRSKCVRRRADGIERVLVSDRRLSYRSHGRGQSSAYTN